MSEGRIKEALDAITIARTAMLLKYPFYGSIAMYLEPVAVVPDEKGQCWLNTLATDGKHLYYNPEFVLSLSKQELVYGIAHEILHCVYNHVGRCPDPKQARLWNIAIDYITNYALVKNRIGKMIAGGLFDPRYNEDEWTAEEVFQDLVRRQKNGENFDSSQYDSWDQHISNTGDSSPDNNDDKTDKSKNTDEKQEDGQGNGNDENGPKVISGDQIPEISEKDLEIIKNELNAILIHAVDAASHKNAGQIPASILRKIQNLTDPKLDWRDILVPYLRSMHKEDYHPRRLHKKAWAREMYIPALNYSETPTAVVFIDASGSISEDDLIAFLSEVKGCMEQFTDFTLHVGCFDTKVYNFKEFTPHNLHEIEEYEIKGGGGTDFECFFEYMKRNDIVPDRLVVFTDGYPCGSWGDPDYCDTLWIIKGSREKPPFGQFVYYEEVS